MMHMTKCDIVDQGSQPQSESDMLPTNVWAVKPFVQGRKEAVALLSSRDGVPHNLCVSKGEMLHRFYVELDLDDLEMVVIPPHFWTVLKVFLRFHLPTSICVSANCSCEDWVSVTELDGQMVLSRGWHGFVVSHGLQLNDILVFSLKYHDLQVKICKARLSTLILYLCPRHS
jgi:hypothetical protein